MPRGSTFFYKRTYPDEMRSFDSSRLLDVAQRYQLPNMWNGKSQNVKKTYLANRSIDLKDKGKTPSISKRYESQCYVQ